MVFLSFGPRTIPVQYPGAAFVSLTLPIRKVKFGVITRLAKGCIVRKLQSQDSEMF